jgi:mono/diheme cytochrome c family protein
MKKINYKKYLFEVKENPGKIFGVVYIYIFVVGFFFGIHYVNNISAVTRQSVPPSLPDTTNQAELKITDARVIPPVNLGNLLNVRPEDLETGKNLYFTVCASCHGEGGNGKGPAGTGLNPPPRDFTIKDGWKNSPSLSGIYLTLEEGIPGTAMVSYDYMPPDEKLAIAQYIRNTFVPSPPPVTQDEITSLDQRYNLSKGTEVSAQIPVASAKDLYLRDKKNNTEQVINTIRQLSGAESDGGKIFGRITSDKAKAVTTLSLTNEWVKDKNRMMSVITTGINRNGFNSEVFYLSDNDWDVLHNFLVSIF